MKIIFKTFIKISLIGLIGIMTPLIGQSQPTLDSVSLDADPQALPLVQISDFGRKSLQLIQDTELLISQHEEIDEIPIGLEKVQHLIEIKMEELQDSTSVYQLDRLDKEARELELVSKQLTQWKNTIEETSTDGIKKTLEIERMVKVWQLTSDSLNTNRVMKKQKSNKDVNLENILSEIEKFIGGLQAAETDLNEYLESLHSIQTQVTIAENSLANASNLLSVKRENVVGDIWFPEAPPIWEVESDTSSVASRFKFIAVFKNDFSIISAFLKNSPKLPYYMVLYFSIIFMTILYLRSKAKEMYKDFKEELLDANIILQKPLLSALLISWFSSLLFTIFPKELNTLVSIVILLPLLVILRQLNPDWKGRTVVLFGISYFLFLLSSRLDYNYLGQRIFLLSMDILALWLFLYIRKQDEHIKMLNEFCFGTLPFLIQLYISICIISIIANVIGSIQLAQLLTTVILGTIIAIHILRVAVSLSRNFVFLILMGPLIKHSYILQEDSKLVLLKMNHLFKSIGFASFLIIILNLFNVRKEVFSAISTMINYRLSIGEVGFSLGNILAFFISIQVAIWLSSFTRFILEKEIFPRSNLKPGIPNTISLMVRFTFALFGILIAFGAAGIQIDKLAIGVGALGVGIGFGLQNIVNNFVSGIILALERPITIGDIIDIPSASGTVKDIGLRASIIRTWDGSDVIVANGELISQKLTNWTYYDRQRRVIVEVRVPFNSNMEDVSKLLLDTAKRIPEVMKKPAPYLNYKGIGTSAMEINLYCWINDADKIFSYGTAIRKAVYKSLRDAGYHIPIPKQSLTIHTDKNSESTDDNDKNDEETAQ